MNYFKKIESVVIIGIILVLGVVYGILSQKANAPTGYDNNQPPSETPYTDQKKIDPNSDDQGLRPIPLSDDQSAGQTTANSEIKYNGVAGQNALQLLKAAHRVETQDFGSLGEFVKSINGVEPDTSHYWALYVNGSQSQVGASAYQTKPADVLEWKLEKIQ